MRVRLKTGNKVICKRSDWGSKTIFRQNKRFVSGGISGLREQNKQYYGEKNHRKSHGCNLAIFLQNYFHERYFYEMSECIF